MPVKEPNMSLKVINRVCYTLCVVSICGSALTGMGVVWLDPVDDAPWRILASFLILFFAAGATLAVNNELARSRQVK